MTGAHQPARSIFFRIKQALLGTARMSEEARFVQRLRVVEVEDAAAMAGDLFFRNFRQVIPDFPRHFLLVREMPSGESVTLGYVHHTPFESSYLAGGLVVDAWKFRHLSGPEQAEVRERGGMAEWLMADSCRLLDARDAVFACIGDAKSLTVNLRVGFRATEHPYLYILASPTARPETLQPLAARVAARGLF